MTYDYYTQPYDDIEYKKLTTSLDYMVWHNKTIIKQHVDGIFQFKVSPGYMFIISQKIYDDYCISFFAYKNSPSFFLDMTNKKKIPMPLGATLGQWFANGNDTYSFDGIEWIHRYGVSKTAHANYVLLGLDKTPDNGASELSIDEQRKKDGKCIKCGGDTDFINLALVCKKCGCII